MSLLIQSGSRVPEEVMLPRRPAEGLDEPSKSIKPGTAGRQVGREELLGRKWQSQDPGLGESFKLSRMMGAGGAGLSGCCGELEATEGLSRFSLLRGEWLSAFQAKAGKGGAQGWGLRKGYLSSL